MCDFVHAGAAQGEGHGSGGGTRASSRGGGSNTLQANTNSNAQAGTSLGPSGPYRGPAFSTHSDARITLRAFLSGSQRRRDTPQAMQRFMWAARSQLAQLNGSDALIDLANQDDQGLAYLREIASCAMTAQVPARQPGPPIVSFQTIIIPLMELVTLPGVLNSPMSQHSSPVILTVSRSLNWQAVAACVRQLPTAGIAHAGQTSNQGDGQSWAPATWQDALRPITELLLAFVTKTSTQLEEALFGSLCSACEAVREAFGTFSSQEGSQPGGATGRLGARLKVVERLCEDPVAESGSWLDHDCSAFSTALQAPQL